MGPSQLRLLASRRFLGLFVAQFCGALNDNLFKNALVIEVAYRSAGTASEIEQLVTIATALFILPYFLFSATAGQLADKYEKANLIRLLKLWEVAVMALAAVGFAVGGLGFGLTVLFLLGVQAAFFGPVKYGILPGLLAADELVSGNAVIEAGTFLAILIGTIAGGLLILLHNGPAIVAMALMTFAVSGWVASLFIPHVGRAAPELRINPNIVVETWRVLRYANANHVLRWVILGNSWFWFVGVAMVSQFPNYAKDVLGADNQVVTFFLTANSIGIGAGSMLAGRLLRGKLTARLVPLAALAMALFAFDLWLVDGKRTGTDLVELALFLTTPTHWRLSIDLLGLALAGGVFVVPLYAIMQARSEVGHRARIVAANNVWNALFMVAAGLGSALMLRFGAGVTDIFLVVALGNAAVAMGTWRLRRKNGKDEGASP
jgi:acyl-[acyl-carrier-protein]-phospholipid O-acyltransferase / long-chain-fatty-acid--[acyl-carrier-protein] ligase